MEVIGQRAQIRRDVRLERFGVHWGHISAKPKLGKYWFSLLTDVEACCYEHGKY